MTNHIVRTPYCHKIRYGITGAPTIDESEMDGSHAPGIGVRPSLIELVYSSARDGKPASVSASVTGEWTRFGKPADGQVAVHFKGAVGSWPAWLAEEARLHDPAPAVVSPPVGQAAEIASCPGYEANPNPCRCPCEGCKHHCSAHDPDSVTGDEAVDRAAVLAEAAGWFDGHSVTRFFGHQVATELRRLSREAAPDNTETPQSEPEELTEEQIVRNHVTTLHLIGEQLADVESWMWEQLAKARATETPCGPQCSEQHTYMGGCALKPPPMNPRRILGINPGFAGGSDGEPRG